MGDFHFVVLLVMGSPGERKLVGRVAVQTEHRGVFVIEHNRSGLYGGAWRSGALVLRICRIWSVGNVRISHIIYSGSAHMYQSVDLVHRYS